MNFSIVKNLNEKQKTEVLNLWNIEFPKEVSISSLSGFDQYLQRLSRLNHVLLCDEYNNVKGWLIYFIRNNEHSFVMLLDRSLQGQGWGSKLLDIAKQHNSELNGWVIDNDQHFKQNGENYKSPIGFYRKNGFEIRTDITDTRLQKKNINGIKVVWKSTEK